MFKGYYIPSGYKGWVGDRYMLFATIEEYYEYMETNEDEEVLT